MVKARSTQDTEVSLFPFMSILVCVIGILMLMITAIALGQIGKDNVSEEEVAEQAQRVNEYAQIQKQIRSDASLVADLKQSADSTTKKKQQLEAALEELANLKQLRKQADDLAKTMDEELARSQAEADRLREEIQQTEAEIQDTDTSVKKLKSELDERKKPPEEADVIIQPSGSGAQWKPTFVECAASSVVLFDGPEPKRVPRSKLSKSEDFARLLDRIRNQDDATMIFLIRPDGIGTYNAARHIARTQYVRNGKLAIATQGKIDLSRYQNSSP